jgi:hypothetical protein
MADQTSLENSATNLAKLSVANEAMRKLIHEALQRGFYGTVLLELDVADGTIQQVHEKTHRVRR